jgi:MarR family transcriptional regulator for hemolysin
MSDRLLKERAFSAALLRLARVYRREVDKALAAHGLSDAKALPVLHIARRGDGVRQGLLAEDMGIEGPSLVGLLDPLCAAGLVERRPDPQDRRAKTLHLSEPGRELAVVVEQAVDALRAQLLQAVDDKDLAAALRVLSAFDRAIEGAESQGA